MTRTIRRLAAILAADMAGYSRLLGLDEVGTLAALRGLRQELIDPAIAAYRGRIVKTTGDGMLVEFSSVVDAVQCAIAVQGAMQARTVHVAEDRRIDFRIGINLGEIVFEGDDIYGDGVNVAARLEQLAQPGGVCVSSKVYVECAGKIDASFSDGGERELKNIATPVHVWHWAPVADSPAAGAPQMIEGKPSIAVLPFVNISSDPEQEYFADGMTEDIITGLSCDSRLFVVARNSTFAYKGQSPDIRTVGRELGVRYVLEGSIRPMGARLRITVQLIETASGMHIWAEKIDRPKAEIFDVMDEVVDELVTALCSNLGVAEANRAARARPENLQAWALCVQAEGLWFTQPDGKSIQEAEGLARRAAGIEPGYAVSWALLGLLASHRIIWWLSADWARDSSEALSLVSKALRLAPNDPVVLGYCAEAVLWAGQAALAIDYFERSLAINPNNGQSRISYGAALWAAGRPEDGVTQLEVFLRRSPKDPAIGRAHTFIGWCYLAIGDFQRAEQSARNAVKHSPGFAWGFLLLGVSLAALGRGEEARSLIHKVNQLEPGMTRQHVEGMWNHTHRAPGDAEKLIALTRQAWVD